MGAKQPLAYEAVLVNPKPVGRVWSTGHFGPWQDDNPRDTPLDGSYEFTQADLSSIHGIGGILSSTGRFGGTLGKIAVAGVTDTPDFRLYNNGFILRRRIRRLVRCSQDAAQAGRHTQTNNSYKESHRFDY